MTDSSIRVCRTCARYSLAERCPSCGAATRSPHPARYSPEDRWGRYRRALLAEAGSVPGS